MAECQFAHTPHVHTPALMGLFRLRNLYCLILKSNAHPRNGPSPLRWLLTTAPLKYEHHHLSETAGVCLTINALKCAVLGWV